MLALLTAAFYIIFTLLPDSNSLVVAWPWVFIWQVGLACPVLWWLGQVWQGQGRRLGNGLDWLVGGLALSLIVSTIFAQFRMQAIWYSWAAACVLAGLYAIASWLDRRDRQLRLLTFQGYLNLAFIAVSLGLWTSQTWLPELERLRSLYSPGLALPYDFSQIELRNWAPIGHQNYVAGYLVLALPLLLALGIVQTGWRRWLWFTGFGLGLVDLYTTSSRAGWLAIVVLAAIGIGALVWFSALPRRWTGLISLGCVAVLLVLVLTNNRLRSLTSGATSGEAGGELAYRLITIATGWQVGLNHLFTGAGLGNVPLLYQRDRPFWAGREAELVYQLHSTPAQLWAELGLGAIGLGIGAIVLFGRLFWCWLRKTEPTSNRILIGSLFAGLLGYAIVSLFDFQLDNLCISGTLIVFLAVLTREVGSQKDSLPLPSRFALVGVGVLGAIVLWLVPVHRAWMLSSQGFAALRQQNVAGFVQPLTQAHQLAQGEPYYAHQLGWNLGNLGLQGGERSPQLLNDSINWFRQGNQSSPFSEFGHTNLGWLLLNRDPKAATAEFARSAALLPAKRGVFYGLGLSLLSQGKSDLAVEAIALEILRDPVLLTSPIWNLPQLQPLFGPAIARVEARYTTILNAAKSSSLVDLLRQSRGALRWWLGDTTGARADWDGSSEGRLLLDLSAGKPVQSQLAQLPQSPATLAIAAWLQPQERATLLKQAWILATRKAPPPEKLTQLVAVMGRSPSFEEWLKQAPPEQYRRERAGFGVLSRHIDGPIPVDFLTVVENPAIVKFFPQLVPSPIYAPDLDRALQPDRDALLKKL
ncbi:MAG TPA: O-antigen ligase family protein [Thermosynechococcaceae cyanobacterium]